MNIGKFLNQFRFAPQRMRNRSQMTVERLEERATPSISPAATIKVRATDRFGAVLDLNQLTCGNDGVADSVEARRNGDSLELFVNGTVTESKPLNQISQLSIFGSSDAD